MDIMQMEGPQGLLARGPARFDTAQLAASKPKLLSEPRTPHALDRLDDAARTTLTRWSSSDDNRRRNRAQIILLTAEGLSPDQVSVRLAMATPTVYKWLRRFAREGLTGLSDLPRSGQPHRLSKEKRAEILRVTRDELPPKGTRWTIRVAARYLGVTQHQVRQVWSDASLKPHDLPRSALPRVEA